MFIKMTRLGIPGCLWGSSSDFILLFGFILISFHVSPQSVAGECIDTGKVYSNQSVWQPDPCTVCMCDDHVVLCEKVQCSNPNCNFEKGERLELEPGGCCPVCSSEGAPCDVNGQIVSDSTEWRQGDCTTCFCGHGNVFCVNDTCPLTPCQPGEVNQLLPGQCCPVCIPVGRHCIDDEGNQRMDGAQWSPLPCVQCVCRDGHSRCMPRQCPGLHCDEGVDIVRSPGECCPSCATPVCKESDRTYEAHDSWTRDACTYCTCEKGRALCRQLACNNTLTCAQNEIKITREDECCPQCVSDKPVCVDESGARHYHGDLWRVSDCEYCTCSAGEINCQTVRCGRVVCGQGDVKIQDPRSCCPRCERLRTCTHMGQIRLAGESWDPDPCSMCRCEDGKVTCYKKICPKCPQGTASSHEQGRCCGACVEVTCSEECARCQAESPNNCTECRQVGKLIQDGRCVDECRVGFFPGSDNVCYACHENCETCFDQSKHHCLSCPPHHLMQSGQCVPKCFPNYFQMGVECFACHPSCKTCHGPRRDHCNTCRLTGQVLMRGQCTDSCGSRTFLKDLNCQVCPQQCQMCLPDGPQCLFCPPKMVWHNGQCLAACPRGFYADEHLKCQVCHPSCLECAGPLLSDCVACVHGSPADTQGICPEEVHCRTGQYLDENKICMDCGPGCSTCHTTANSIQAVCSQCVDPSKLPSGAGCRENCPKGSYLRDGICFTCSRGCEICEGQGHCRKCASLYYLYAGHCVQSCGQKKFPDERGICRNCGTHCLACTDFDHCMTCDGQTLLREGECVRTCGQGYISLVAERICEANSFRPILKTPVLLKVSEGGMTDVTEDIVKVEDEDTPADHIKIVLDTPSTVGHLIKIDMNGNSLISESGSFSLQDLHQGKIRFIHGKNGLTQGSLALKAYDGQMYSDQGEITVQVEAGQKLSLVVNKPLLALENGQTPITTNVLDVQSKEDVNAVLFQVLDGPLHGNFTHKGLGKEVKEFKYVDLMKGLIAYQHTGDGNNMSVDSARLVVSDGFEQMSLVFIVKIQSKSHQTPVLLSNTGGEVFKGDSMRITKQMLEAKTQKDKATERQGVIYTLVPMSDNPKYGEILMMVPIPQEGPGRGWTDMGGGMMGARLFRFMQRDIDEGRIYYKHTGTGINHDFFTFEVADLSTPPNILKDQRFDITVLSDKTSELSLPTLAPGVRLGMTVLENQIVPITSNVLAFNDMDTSNKDIVYRITTLLSEDEGTVEHINFPFSPVLQFTQDDINNNRIIYRPPSEDIGTKEIDVSFRFVVSDGGEDRQLSEHKFTIRVVPVNNSPPFFINPNPELTVAEGGTFPLTPGILEVVDPDTELEDLKLEIMEAPNIGVIEKVSSGMVALIRHGDTFSYKEVMESTIQYRHTGQTNPLLDEFTVTVNDGAHRTGNTVYFTIIKADKSAPVVFDTASCQLNVSEGSSVVVNRQVMAYSDEENNDNEVVIILASDIVHGDFVLTKGDTVKKITVGDSFTQEDVNEGRLSFKSEHEIGSKAVTELVYINVTDNVGNVLPRQILSVRITPVDNLPPDVVMGPDLKVEEGGEAPLNVDTMAVLDIDSPLEKLTVVVEKQPTFGALENRITAKGSEERRRDKVSSFPLTDLIDGHMYYVQTDHKNKEPAWDAFLFSVNDGINKSPLHRFNITILPINDEPPQIVTEQLFAREGKVVTLTNASLYINDLDTAPQDLLFTLLQPPSNGLLLKKEFTQDSLEKAVSMKRNSTFSYQDILEELIVYKHNDAEVSQDSLRLHLTDGDFTDTKTLNIIVGLINDETPRVTINRGLRVQAGSTTAIRSKDLKATDLDSEDSEIKYTLSKDPLAGHLKFDNGDVSYILTSSSAAKSFKQRDIDRGHISYTHVIGEATGNILFKFMLSDPEGNDLIDQDFFITVLEDRLLPIQVENKEFLVTEGQSAKLTTEFLSFTDADTEPGTLTYTIIDGPTLGHLEMISKPGEPIQRFTQSDLAANIIVYKHTSPAEKYSDDFTFAVSDGTNEIIQSFYINIAPVDDSIPLLSNKGLKVQEGVRKLITEFDLKAVDPDTKESSILFTIIESPQHGSVDRLTDTTWQPASTFSMEDIYENRVSYQHDGSETKSDKFHFLLSDGTNSVFAMQQDSPSYSPISTPQAFDITVQPMDDGMPIIQTNLGLQYLESNGVDVGSIITSKDLFSTDEDTAPEHIVYVITEMPLYGVLEHTGNPAVQITSFTQDDVNKGVLRYRLTSISPSLEDSFSFDVMDSKPNVVPDNKFHITWSEISVGQALFNVTETQGIVQIPILRKGNLKQYSVVKCQTIPGSAMSRTDVDRPGLQDFIQSSGQVQFEEWQTKQMCTIITTDDSVYEGPETFYVEITSPTFAVLGNVRKAAVTIYDSEDEPMLQFQSDVFQVNETDKYAMAPIVRSGDLSGTVSVICSTKSLTATGSSLTSLESGSDYVSRGQTNAYRVVFPPGVSQATCDVKLIDDSQYENMEQFELELSSPSIPATLGPVAKSLVIITGPNDVSTIYFASDNFAFPEDSGSVDIEILRDGSDLSHISMVQCSTRLSDPASATPGEDYVPTSAQVVFGPEETSQICHLTILDDDYEPRLEGNETFVVFLSSAMGSSLHQPVTATITIYDQDLDVPEMNFLQDSYFVDESIGVLDVLIVRHGDISLPSSVICFTRQETAKVMKDFQERTFSNASLISFLPDERNKTCSVHIVDDADFEPDETFTLRLALPEGPTDHRAVLGDLTTATITITNHDDVPRIQFEEAAYSVHEPSVTDHISTVDVKVIRLGATNKTATVRCSTRDGSAQSGLDYNPKSVVLTFEPGVRDLIFSVDILYNSAIEWHESFSLQLGPEEPTNSIFGDVTTTTITILDNEVSGSIILPAAPIVVSLLHYDDAEQGMKINPSPGYPLVCLTPCEMHYPTFSTTSELCREAGINQTAMMYQWEVAMPASGEGVMPTFVKVTAKTLFTSVNTMVLDSIYFRPHFQVRCIALPLHENGNPGVPLHSSPVTIGHSNPICSSPSFTSLKSFSYQAQSFLASLEYVSPDQSQHPNTVHVSVQIPHQDGMLPLISTQPLTNLRFLLSEPVYRQQHICSNLIPAEERAALFNNRPQNDDDDDDDAPEGTMSPQDWVIRSPGFDFPHQFDAKLREAKTLELYKHLNLKNCIWQFDAWYHMTELVDLCGGQIVSDFEVKDKSNTHLTVRVPLYVSYVYSMAPTGWGSMEHRTEMEFSFYYNTVLWRAGLETEGRQGGRLQVVRILIGEDGKLVIEFRTQAKFRGLFVLSHHTLPKVESRVVPPKALSISFDLELVWSQQTFDSPHQVWQAKSHFNLKDYTGVYQVELIPCVVAPTQGYVDTDPLPCAAQEPQQFDIPITFQQTNRPVPVLYSLNTDFQLSNSLKMFLLDPGTEGMLPEDWYFSGTFSRGQKLYGRVLWNPEQDLRTAYRLLLEKVYVCTGRDGYIPTYDPHGEIYGEGKQFGCIQPSKNLLHRFLVLDRENPDVAMTDFHQVPFNAEFANDNEEFSAISNLPGVDGFVMDIDPLYKVDSGHQWYLQVVYTITSADFSKHKVKRSIVAAASSIISGPQHWSLWSDSHTEKHYRTSIKYPYKSRRWRRDALAVPAKIKKHNLTMPIVSNNSSRSSGSLNGTNMKILHLAYPAEPSEVVEPASLHILLLRIGVPVGLVVLLAVILIVVFVRRRKKNVQSPKSSRKAVAMNNQLQPLTRARTVSDVCKSQNRQNHRKSAASLSKCNVIIPKDVNVLSRQGVDVHSGTEV